MSPRRPNTARRPLGALNPDYCARPFSARAMRRTVGYLSARRPRGGSRRAPHPEGGTNRPTGENGSIADPFFGVQPLYLSDPCGGRGVPLCAEQRAGGDCSARTFCYLSLLGVSNCASQNQGAGTAGNRAYFGWGVDCLRVALSFIVPTSGDPQSLGVRPEWAGRNFLGDCLGHGRMRIRARALNWGKGARAGRGSVVGGGVGRAPVGNTAGPNLLRYSRSTDLLGLGKPKKKRGVGLPVECAKSRKFTHYAESRRISTLFRACAQVFPRIP